MLFSYYLDIRLLWMLSYTHRIFRDQFILLLNLDCSSEVLLALLEKLMVVVDFLAPRLNNHNLLALICLMLPFLQSILFSCSLYQLSGLIFTVFITRKIKERVVVVRGEPKQVDLLTMWISLFLSRTLPRTVLRIQEEIFHGVHFCF